MPDARKRALDMGKIVLEQQVETAAHFLID